MQSLKTTSTQATLNSYSQAAGVGKLRPPSFDFMQSRAAILAKLSQPVHFNRFAFMQSLVSNVYSKVVFTIKV
jgi:hypothetical protein